MYLVVGLSLLFQAASPTAQAAAVLPEAPKPAPVVVQSRPKAEAPKIKLTPKPRKNRAFIAALPQPAQPRWTAPLRVSRLIPDIDEQEEADSYLDVFLNEEAEDLLE